MTKKRKTILYCLSYAGGSSYAYRDFAKHIDNTTIEVIPLDLPGHGKRLREPLLTDINEMAEFIFSLIDKSIIEVPYALYGHSMGATVGYQLCRVVENARLPLPLHLFFSSRQAPSLPVKDKDRNYHLLPRDKFIKKVMEYGGIPREVAAEKELMDLFVPILKADFKAVDEYHCDQLDPLDIPITILFGNNERITYEDVREWQEVTHHDLSIQQFSGGHFFIFEHLPEIGRIISRSLIDEPVQVSY